MATKTSSKHQKELYTAYRTSNRWEINKRKKLKKHLKNFPNDLCAKNALERGFKYSRKSPKSKEWSKTDIHAVQLFKEFGHSGTEYLRLKKERIQGRKSIDD